MTSAPIIGPIKVPTPPTRVIKITSPDIDQCESESVSKPINNACKLPAKPAKAPDKIKASSLKHQQNITFELKPSLSSRNKFLDVEWPMPP